MKPGDQVNVSIFTDGERVDVIGTSRGKGFQGVVKRHHFSGGRATHGSMFHRAPGSIGASSYPSRVVKGMRMAGHMGAGQVTVRNLKVLRIDAENNLLMVEGAVPGGPNSVVVIRKAIAAKPMTSGPGRTGEEEGQEVGTAMTVDVVNGQNEKVGSLELRDEVFGGRIKTDLIHESVVRANAAERRGTHATKTRAMVSGSGKKPWRQKGTGRARVGEIRNPLWRKGGTVFGPQPRSYEYRVPRKVEKGALRAALAQKLRDGQVVVVDALSVAEIKTKAAAEMLKRLGIDGKALLVDTQPEDKLTLSVRNIDGVRVLPSNRVSARDVMDTRRVVLTQAALERLQEALG